MSLCASRPQGIFEIASGASATSAAYLRNRSGSHLVGAGDELPRHIDPERASSVMNSRRFIACPTHGEFGPSIKAGMFAQVKLVGDAAMCAAEIPSSLCPSRVKCRHLERCSAISAFAKDGVIGRRHVDSCRFWVLRFRLRPRRAVHWSVATAINQERSPDEALQAASTAFDLG